MSETLNRRQRRALKWQAKKRQRSQAGETDQPNPDGADESFPPWEPPGSLSRVPPEAKRLFNKLDGMADLRLKLSVLTEIKEEWAGIPMPMRGCNLVIEPSYPNATALMEASNEAPEVDPVISDPTFNYRNSFWSTHHRRTVFIWEVGGKIRHGLEPQGTSQVSLLLGTLEASDAWGVEQEANAMTTLGTLVRHRLFKQYCLTGMFLETSARSGVHYLFRRLRPTIAFSTKRGYLRFIAALCLHPIAYYDHSWAGAMCPTDDVIAHLMLMRGDEHMFWRRANQHPPWASQAGIG